MLKIKKSLLALSFGIGLTSLFAAAAPQCGTDARCYMDNSRSIGSCMRTTNPVTIDGVRYDRYNTRAECEAAYAEDLQRCLSGEASPWGCR